MKCNDKLMLALAATGLVVLSFADAYATEYSAQPIAGNVIDAATGAPVEGAIVVANWIVEDPLVGQVQGSLELKEALTDRNGDFRLEGWGPTPVLDVEWPAGARIPPGQPHIRIFKPGYKLLLLREFTTTEYLDDPQWKGASLRDSYWNGKMVKLERFDGSLAAYAERTQYVLTGVGYYKCKWKKVPRSLTTLIREGEHLRQLGIHNYLPTLGELEKDALSWKCGSAKDFLSEYLK